MIVHLWRRTRTRFRSTFAAVAVLTACAFGVALWAASGTHERGSSRDLGDHLFRKEFTPEDGLGPLFNEQACSSCHVQPAVGGMGPEGLATVLRVGRLTGSGFDQTFGKRRIEAHAHSISELGADCDRAAGIPAGANVTSVRNTPPLFGAGVIDAIPDEVIRAGARVNRDGVTGRPNLVPGPDGRNDLGRFGWKADGPTLELFVAEAFRAELGLTSPLAPAGPLPARVQRCTGESSDPDIGEDVVQAVTSFVARLAPPRPEGNHPHGEAIFERTGCATCHTPELDPGVPGVPIYSDLLLHDMGPALDDGVTQGSASGAEWRTTPLWGLGDRIRFLHDGRADSIEAAILAHAGEAETARERFSALSDADLRSLLDFLRSL